MTRATTYVRFENTMIFTISIWSDETDWRRNKIRVQECKRIRKDEYDRDIASMCVFVLHWCEY